MPTKNPKLLKIYEHEIKCLNCYSKFGYNFDTTEPWSFCPRCGASAPVVTRKIEYKKYHDNFGYHRQINGEWQHVKSPEFVFTVEFKDIDGEWEKYSHYPVTRDHHHLKHYMKTLNRGDRWRIVPSKPLPLP